MDNAAHVASDDASDDLYIMPAALDAPNIPYTNANSVYALADKLRIACQISTSSWRMWLSDGLSDDSVEFIIGHVTDWVLTEELAQVATIEAEYSTEDPEFIDFAIKFNSSKEKTLWLLKNS